MTGVFFNFGHHLLSALLNGVYQGMALTMLVWAVLGWFRGNNASTRYAALLAALVLVAALPAFHFVAGGHPPAPSVADDGIAAPASVRRDLGVEQADGVHRRIVPNVSPADPLGAPTAIQWERTRGFRRTKDQIATFHSKTRVRVGAAVPGPSRAEPAKLALPESEFSKAPIASLLSGLGTPRWQATLPSGFGAALIGLWWILAGFRLAALAWQYHRLHRIKREGRPAPERLQALFGALSDSMGLKRRAHLLTSTVMDVPMALGFWRPAVVLPAPMLEATKDEDWERILRHELAHVGRRDDWTNLLQQLIKAILFFHPGILWLARRLTLEREIACDDHVLAAMSKGGPAAYALFLTEFAGRNSSRPWAAAPAAWSHQSQLRERIVMILDRNRNSSVRLARAKAGTLALAAIGLAAMAFAIGPRLALAEEPVAPSGDKAPAIKGDGVGVIASSGDHRAVISAGTATITAGLPEEPAAANLPSSSQPKPHSDSIAVPGSHVQIARKPPARASAKSGPAIHGADQVAPSASPADPNDRDDVEVGQPPALAEPQPPVPPAAPRPKPTPRPSAASKERPDQNLEERLERLERAIESLLASRSELKWKNWNEKEDLNFEFDQEGMRELLEHAAESARRAAERAEHDYLRTHKEIQDRQGERMRTELEAQRRALMDQRKALDKMIQELDEQLADGKAVAR